ncbi:CD3324 family protein [Paenibacillus aceti]|uniref:Mor transcription activator domain-containing protein n=1 Tax=Paenibacillus aceti TaxID=1820010 RepID=A0ABQ1VZ50_9BACL|nr:CD3324 family protein [Paenibacillus aceti]GGG03318.1 hypothetical protein GCM10010913_26400 [Paenibacillus aceti]
MKYQNAETILPQELLNSIQQYTQGNYLYIPMRRGHKKPWGERSGYRQMLKQRNDEIVRSFQSGITVKSLAQHYYLSERSIRRIIHDSSTV